MQVKSNFRTAITVPEKCWTRFRDILADYCDKMCVARPHDSIEHQVSTLRYYQMYSLKERRLTKMLLLYLTNQLFLDAFALFRIVCHVSWQSENQSTCISRFMTKKKFKWQQRIDLKRRNQLRSRR